MSSWRSSAYSRRAYHRESQPSMTPRRNPFGCTFCPTASGLPAVTALVDDDRDVAGPLEDRRGATVRARQEALPRRTFVDVGLLHEELVDVDASAVLGIRDGGLERLRDDLRAALRRELQNAERLFDAAAADEIDDEARLLCRQARVPGAGASF